MQQNHEKRFMNVTEVAAYLGVSQHTIRAWIKRGYVPFSKLGRAIRFDLRKLEVWLKQREINAIDR